MNKLKCRRCGLVNAQADLNCRRCGEDMDRRPRSSNAPRSPREAAKKSSWLYTILFLALIISAASYLFKGIEKSYDEINANELNQSQPPPNQQHEGLSDRSEADRKRAEAYRNAMQDSPGIAESQKRLNETRRLMQSDADKTKK